MRHLCKNMQKAVQGTASRLLAFIGIGGHSLAISAPVPEDGATRIQITTFHAHKFTPVPVVEPVRGGPWVNAHGVPAPYPHHHQEGRFDGPFLHRAHRALMALGPWEGRIVAFVLGAFFFFALSLLALTTSFLR